MPGRIEAAGTSRMFRLSWIIGCLVVAAAGAGLAQRSVDHTYSHVTARGETIEIYGYGIYRHSSTFQAGANQGSDAVALLFGVPLLLTAAVL
jgi:hypothetical protein